MKKPDGILAFRCGRSLPWLILFGLALFPITLRSQDKTFDLAGVPFILGDSTERVDVYFQSLRFNRALEVWNVEVSISNKSPETLQGPVVLLVDSYAGTTGPIGPDGMDDSTPARAYYDLTGVLGGTHLSPGEKSGMRTLSLGISSGSPSLQMRTYSSAIPTAAFALAFTRTLNEAGQPLPAATIEAIGGGGGATNQSDPVLGLATLGRDAGEFVFKFSAPGYLPVWRRSVLAESEVAVLPNPRLTKRSSSTVTFQPVSGGQLASEDGSVEVGFAAAAFAQDTVGTLTPLSGQGLPGFLPLGWSPLAAFWLELERSPNLSGDMTLTPWETLTPGKTAYFVKWDSNGLLWRVLQAVAGTASDTVTVAVSGAGAYALVVADTGAGAPPAPLIGQPLLPSSVQPPAVSNLVAGGTVTPAVSAASRSPQAVTARAEVNITNLVGPVPSGLLLRGDASERYELSDGTRRFLPPYETFVVGYQRPGDTDASTLRATFPMRPRLLFGPGELNEAVIRMDVVAPDGFEGGVLTTNGGLLAVDGIRLLAGPGTVSSPQVARLRSLNVTNFTDLVGSALEIVAAFELNIGQVAPGQRLVLQVNDLIASNYFVAARVIAGEQVLGLEPVERLMSDGSGKLVGLEPVTGERLPGINSAGQYVLVRVGEPQGLVAGVARNGSGLPAAGLVVTIPGLPWVTLSDVDGAYRLVAPVGTAVLSILDPQTGDTGQGMVEVVSADAPTGLELDAVASGPRVISVTPTNGATRVPRVTSVVVTFSEPVNPASLVGNGLRVLNTNSQSVAGSVTLNLNTTTATFLPSSQLDAGATYTILLASNVTDLTGLPLEGQHQFVFTTVPSSTRDPAAQLVIYEPGATNIPTAILDEIPAFTPGEEANAIVVHGSPGTADPEVAVILANESSGETATVLSKPDGSFSSYIHGGEEDFVSATFINLNGTRVYVPVSRQEFDNGFVGLYQSGGILEAESDGGPVQVLVEPGSVPEKTKFKVEAIDLLRLQAALEVLPTNGAVLLGGFAMAQSGDELLVAPDVSFPIDTTLLGLPAGSDPTNASFALTVPRELDDGTMAYEIVDRMHYEDGKLVTHSPPFLGALLKNLYRYSSSAKKLKLSNKILNALGLPGIQETLVHELFLPMMLAQGTSVTIHGTIRAAEFDNNGDPVSGTLRIVPGAAITLVSGSPQPGRPGRINPGGTFCTSREDGKYAFLVPINLIDGPATYLLTATHPAYFPQQAAGGGTIESLAKRLEEALIDFNLGLSIDLYFSVIDTTLSTGGDTTAPRVSFAQDPRDPAPGTNVADGVTITLAASDDRQMASLVYQVNDYEPLNPAITNFTTPSPQDEVQTNLSPALLQASFKLKSEERASAVIHVTAADASGNQREADYPIVFAGDRAFPPVTTNTPAPRLTSAWPPDGATAVPLGSPLILRFAVPLATNMAAVANTWLQIQNGELAGVTLSPDRRLATVFFNGVTGDDVTFTILTALLGENGKAFDQDPTTTGNQTHTITFAMAAADAQDLTGIQFGGGAVQSGAYVYALERQGQLNGSVKVFDVSGSTPTQVGELSVPGYPRDLVFIPNYSFKFQENGNCVTRNLLAVVGGAVSAESFQYLWVIDVTDPTQPTRIASTAATLAAAALVKLKWSAPFLAYLESGADITSVNLVTLQTFILGMNASQSDIESWPPDGMIGVDANGDGDFCDPDDQLPIPFVSPGTFFGKDYAITPVTAQRIQDFDFDADSATVGFVLSSGYELAPDGKPDRNQPLPGAYVSAFDAQGRIDPADGTLALEANEKPTRLAIFPDVLLEGTNGLTFRTLAIVSAQDTGGNTNKLIVIDVSDARAPVRMGDLALEGYDIPKSLIRREDGLLALATASDVLLIDPSKLLLPNLPSSGPAAIVGVIPGAGGGVRSFDAPVDGLNVVSAGGKNQVIKTGPSIRLLSFPTNAPVAASSLVGLDSSELSTRFAVSREASLLVRSRLFQPNGTNAPTLLPPDPATHYYVRVDLLGDSGRSTLDLVAEVLNGSGTGLANGGSNSLPGCLASTDTLDDLGYTNGSIFPLELTAHRLDPNPEGSFYSVYLAGPITLPRDPLTESQLQSVTQQVDRAVMRSGRMFWVGLDPHIAGQDIPTNALSRVVNDGLVPGTSAFALVDYIKPPVIFIPGVAGSHLVKVSGLTELELWPGLKDYFKDDLSLDPAASPPTIVASDILRVVPAPYGLAGWLPDVAICSFPNIYEPFIHFLTHDVGLVEYDYLKLNKPSLTCEDGGPATSAQKRKKMAEARILSGVDASQIASQPGLFVFPYDWRQGNEDSITNLANYIEVVKLFHPEAEQVDIVAHSMGGLLARRYILEHPGAVNKLITLGTPWLGAPKAINAMETGEFLDETQHAAVISKPKLKELVEYFPGPQQLLPSPAYFDVADAPLKDLAGDLPNNSNGPILNFSQFKQLMDTIYHTNTQVTPVAISESFHTHEESGQGKQDDWTVDNTGVQYFHIAAAQSEANTIGTVVPRLRFRPSEVDPNELFELKREFSLEYTVGDGTVPLASALRHGNGMDLNAADAKLYVLQASDPDEDSITDHNGMLTNTNLQELVRRILDDDIPAETVGSSPTGVVTYVVRVVNAEDNEVVASLFSDTNVTSADRTIAHLQSDAEKNMIQSQEESVPGLQIEEPAANIVDVVLNGQFDLTVGYGGKPISIRAEELSNGVPQTAYIWRSLDPSDFGSSPPSDFEVTVEIHSPPVAKIRDGGGTQVAVVPDAVIFGDPVRDETAPSLSYYYTNSCQEIVFVLDDDVSTNLHGVYAGGPPANTNDTMLFRWFTNDVATNVMVVPVESLRAVAVSNRVEVAVEDENPNPSTPVLIELFSMEVALDPAGDIKLEDWPEEQGKTWRSPKRYIGINDQFYLTVQGPPGLPSGHLRVEVMQEDQTNSFISPMAETMAGSGIYTNVNIIELDDRPNSPLNVVDEVVLNFNLLNTADEVVGCLDRMVDRAEFAGGGVRIFYELADRPVVRDGAASLGFFDAGDGQFADDIGAFPNNLMAQFILEAGDELPGSLQSDFMHISSHGDPAGELYDHARHRAKGEVFFDGSGGIIGVDVVNPGVGYTNTPTVTIIDPNTPPGTGAVINAVLLVDKVDRFEVVSSGSGYSTNTTIRVSSPGPKNLILNPAATTAFGGNETRWNEDVEWVVLAACSTLSLSNNPSGLLAWSDALDGGPRPAHGILGAHSPVSNPTNNYILFWERLAAGDTFVQAYITGMENAGPNSQPWAYVCYENYTNDSVTNLAPDLMTSGTLFVDTLLAIDPDTDCDRSADGSNQNLGANLADGRGLILTNTAPVRAPPGGRPARLRLRRAEPFAALNLATRNRYRHRSAETVEFARPYQRGRVSHLSPEQARTTAEQFLATHLPALASQLTFRSAPARVSRNLPKTGPSNTWTNGYVVQFGLMHQGVPIWGDNVRVTIAGDEVVAVTASAAEVVEEGPKIAAAMLPAGHSLNIALPQIKQALAITGDYEAQETGLYYVSSAELSGSKSNPAGDDYVLAWRFIVRPSDNTEFEAGQVVWVDPFTGALLGRTHR